jgi:hypothetical protein
MRTCYHQSLPRVPSARMWLLLRSATNLYLGHQQLAPVCRYADSVESMGPVERQSSYKDQLLQCISMPQSFTQGLSFKPYKIISFATMKLSIAFVTVMLGAVTAFPFDPLSDTSPARGRSVDLFKRDCASGIYCSPGARLCLCNQGKRVSDSFLS